MASNDVAYLRTDILFLLLVCVPSIVFPLLLSLALDEMSDEGQQQIPMAVPILSWPDQVYQLQQELKMQAIYVEELAVTMQLNTTRLAARLEVHRTICDFLVRYLGVLQQSSSMFPHRDLSILQIQADIDERLTLINACTFAMHSRKNTLEGAMWLASEHME